MKKTIFTGSGVAIVTPMRDDQTINFEELGRIIDHQIAHHTDAIVICGTTGEASTMTQDEQLRCIAHAVQHVAGRVPVIAGVGGNCTAHAVELSKAAASLGADALLHVTPYYNKTSQRGLVRHFTTIADATDLPIILYNVPSRTGLNIAPATYAALAKHPHIVAAKEAGGNISQVAQVAALCGDELDLYSGNDDQIVPILSLGGKGVISVLANVAPQETHDICQLYLAGNTRQSTALQLKLLPLIDALFSDVNPVPVKEAMNLLGWAAGPCRMPLCEMADDARTALREQLQACGLTR